MLNQYLAGGRSEQPAQAVRASPRSFTKAGLGRELAMLLPWRVVGWAAQQRGSTSQLCDFQGALHDHVSKLVQRGGLG